MKSKKAIRGLLGESSGVTMRLQKRTYCGNWKTFCSLEAMLSNKNRAGLLFMWVPPEKELSSFYCVCMYACRAIANDIYLFHGWVIIPLMNASFWLCVGSGGERGKHLTWEAFRVQRNLGLTQAEREMRVRDCG